MRPDEPEERPEEGASKEILDWLRKLPKLLLVSLFLLAIGFLFGIIGKIKFSQILFSIGFSLLFIWLGREIYRNFPKLLKKEEVLDSWSVLIGNAQGQEEEIFNNTHNLILQTKVPNVKMETKAIAPGIVRGLFGTKREFLVVTETGNPRLKPFKMFINARDYGNNLDVSWYLTYKSGFWRRLLYFLLRIPILNLMFLPYAFLAAGAVMIQERRVTPSVYLDLFDEQDLRAYVTNAHHCLIEAVEKLMVNMGQDPSNIDRKSRGFLGIS
ncbi:MAG: hypothetical protein ACOYU0_02185 [Nitrospirota bacterium]